MSINLSCEEDDDLFRQTPTEVTQQCMLAYEEGGWEAGVDRYIQWLKDEHEEAEYEAGQEEQDYRDLMNEHIAHILATAESCGGLTLCSG